MEENQSMKTSGKIIRCKGAICKKAGDALVIEEIEVDPPKAYEVRIKILCTSLCHTDVTFWKMDKMPFAAFPRIFGHEAVGVVESVGDHVEKVKEGDIVVPVPVAIANCEDCVDCKSEKSNICSKFPFKVSLGMPRDGTSRFLDSNGEVIHTFLSVSSFVEYTIVDITHVIKISHEISADKACLLGCEVSTGVGAAWRLACVEASSTVAIFGLGAVGLGVAEGSKIRGASKIIGVDINPDKFDVGVGAAWRLACVEAGFTVAIFGLGAVGLAVAEGSRVRGASKIIGVDINPDKFDVGVTDFINPNNCGEKPVSEVIKEMTNGGADYCFECVGLASLMNEAFTSSRQGWGKTIILGAKMHGSPIIINSYEIMNGKSITGSLFGGIKPKSDIPLFIKSYLDKELNLDDFITHEVSFEDINKAFDLLLQGKSIRCIIWMKKNS